ncbi:MAG: ketoacyl-ACP synthase III [Chitinispirillaceae bacterium]|nr:ketoacyl-ACP synthase III [Chitinispirillaceae bacterium]
MNHFNGARVLSMGTSVPDTILTNSDFEKMVDTTDEWIVTRTGIRSRYVAAKGSAVTTAALGGAAARTALERAGIAPERVDGIICATVTPDGLFPSTACRIQAELGCRRAFAFDISAACAGFIYGLSLAKNFTLSGQGSTFLVIGTEILSRITDYKDRATCILFGDGAGAAVVQGTNDPGDGIRSACLYSDGTLGKILYCDLWGDSRFMYMEGREVFKYAVRMMADMAHRAVKEAGLTFNDIDYLIPHQANIRIIKSLGETLNMAPEKVIVNLENFGNTSSASIPLALNDAVQDGRIRKGSTVLLTALGGGVTVASAVVRF